MRLIELLNGLEYECIQGPLDREVSAVINDSRKVTADSLFLCIKGAKFDGHEYVADVVKQGAAVLVVSEEVHVEEQTTVEEPVTEVKMETQQVKNEKLNERYIQASEDETIRFIEFVSKNFNKLNSTNKGLFVENKPRSISRALRKGSKTVAKLLVPEYVGGKPAIHIKLDSYVKNDVDSFINYVIKNNIVDFSKVTNKF